MRIIAGEARGRRLFAPDGLDTRPTSDRIRESLFNILASRPGRERLEGARVLDLFAGSGALALEALSRGAKHAVINDMSREAVAVIRRNVELLGWADRVTVRGLPWRALIDAEREPFDLVFLDPPYRMTEAYAEAAEALRARGLLAKDALIVMEYRARDMLLLPERFHAVDVRQYGETAIQWVEQRGADA